ncbi:c-type cytochrome [Geothrix sp. PMB-07]|uniref:c-type cytochrome n=1 Tax=Geothrix sp. PMB-07 TaxID=3068640 RepID=UPI0027418630|nr:c-type cytochrome [Geothrix sp. PMB-07]WLT31919.1 c-type cytochrome [Geothrix sp. PMB-07]
MDFPIFHLDFLGNRLLVAMTAILHVLINHPLAVGAYPLITLLEWQGLRRSEPAWDGLAYRVARVVFIITTTVGALTGVGIWLTTALVAPAAIGSLLRVFFWAWFTEWLVFITEVGLIMAYYLTWKRFASPRLKRLHVALGAALSLFSWLTMALIVAILGFMMNSGAWKEGQDFLSAVFNPLYLPQLAFRTTFAMTTAGLFVWFCLFFVTRREDPIRSDATRLTARWTLAWLPLCGLASLWYWKQVPAAMQAHAHVALLTQAFSHWHRAFLGILGLTVLVIGLFALLGASRPRWLPAWALVVPFILSSWLLSHFERVREFIRKPYVIADYMYANGVRVSALPVYQRDGMLPYATYATVKEATASNAATAGKDVFMLACSRCHTTRGVNGVVAHFQRIQGTRPWDEEALTDFIQGMHLTRTYMPPFPGNAAEAHALAVYLKSLQPGPDTK